MSISILDSHVGSAWRPFGITLTIGSLSLEPLGSLAACTVHARSPRPAAAAAAAAFRRKVEPRIWTFEEGTACTRLVLQLLVARGGRDPEADTDAAIFVFLTSDLKACGISG